MAMLVSHELPPLATMLTFASREKSGGSASGCGTRSTAAMRSRCGAQAASAITQQSTALKERCICNNLTAIERRGCYWCVNETTAPQFSTSSAALSTQSFECE